VVVAAVVRIQKVVRNYSNDRNPDPGYSIVDGRNYRGGDLLYQYQYLYLYLPTFADASVDFDFDDCFDFDYSSYGH
jgi:hypothetical protein